MAEVRYKEVKISDVMNLISENHMYTKKFIDENKGEYPVYSATIDKPYGFISSYDFKNKKVFCVVNYGNSGKTYLINDDKFSIGRNISALEVKEELDGCVDLEYVRVVSESKFINNAKGTKQKNLNQRLVKNTKIKIPIKEDGNYDIETQKEIVKKYEIVEEKKKELQEKLDNLKDVQVDFMATELSKSKSMKIKDIFDLSIGSNGSNFTKTFIKNHSGDIPVYGASKDDEIPSYGYVEDHAVINEKKNGKIQGTKVKYFNDCLTYNIDGFAGYIFYREGKFSLSEKVRPLIIKDEYKNYLIPEYLKIAIEPIFRSNRKGRLGESEKNEYTKLYINMIENIELKIPINKDGIFDLEKQREIVSKYKSIDEMK